jgi:hypothetical protein
MAEEVFDLRRSQADQQTTIALTGPARVAWRKLSVPITDQSDLYSWGRPEIFSSADLAKIEEVS